MGDHHRWRQLRAAGGLEGPLGRGDARLFALAYDGVFDSPGVLRQDDIDAGVLGFYGAYPQAGGGRSTRALMGTTWTSARAERSSRLLAWGGYRALDLTRNFTGYLLHPEHGDSLRQAQQGLDLGARARHARHLRGDWIDAVLSGGLDLRGATAEQIEQGLDAGGAVWQERIDASIAQGSLGAWAGAEISVGDWAVFSPGLRTELIGIRLLRHIDDDGVPVEAPRPAWSAAPVLAPKAAMVLLPTAAVSGFASYGRGFRSPEARGIEDGDRAPVTRADSGELGLRWRPAPWLGLRAAGFLIDISNEMVFDHAAGRFLSAGATRRVGAEASTELNPLSWLKAEMELSYADGRTVSTGEPLPYAPRLLGSAGLYALGLPTGPVEWTGGLRVWALGPRPLPEGFYSHPALVADLTLQAAWKGWGFGLDADNLFGTRWRDGEFIYPSCFDPQSGCSELPAQHITAGEPFALHLMVSRSFS